tara:strand:+ start:786 stop:1484 length:699 start_codon:yes stop_codon:yes gene_type:complete
MEKSQQSQETIRGRKTPPKSRLREITPQKVVGEANRIVRMATDILEEEIAAGIVAAKALEKKVIDVEKVRDKDNDHIIKRFRNDAHEVIDMLMDVVSVAATQLETVSNRVVNIIPTSNKPNSQSTQVPIIQSDKPSAPGSTQEIKMQLQNDSDEKVMNVELADADLFAPSGERILARNVSVKPKVLSLKPGEKKHVTIQVKVPKNTKVGKYSGLLQDKNIENLQAMLAVEVS